MCVRVDRGMCVCVGVCVRACVLVCVCVCVCEREREGDVIMPCILPQIHLHVSRFCYDVQYKSSPHVMIRFLK